MIGSGWFFFTSWVEEHNHLLESILTVAAITVAWFLLKETHEQVKHSEQGLWRADSALDYQRWRDFRSDSIQKINTDSSIALSMRIAATQERFAKIETRAYLVPEFRDVKRLAKDTIQAQWTVVNVGKTVARRVGMTAGITFGEPSIETQREVILPTIRYTIGSGRDNQHFGNWYKPPTVLDTIFKGHPIYLTIRIQYEDVFKDIHHSYAHVLVIGEQWRTKPSPEDD